MKSKCGDGSVKSSYKRRQKLYEQQEAAKVK